MITSELNEMKRIVEKLIPLGNDLSLCHVGICSIKRCNRCQDAIKIRELISKLEIEGHIGQ
jgi:hypothetical protein